MITWMQRHKKYLVVTIWISTIAFVGAGFVGWGAYDFNTDRAAAVAKVGDRKITIQEFQMAYSNHYNYYNNIFNGQLTKEKADDMGLDKIVMQNIINETLLLNYAKDLGLVALDEDVKKILLKDEAFLNDGVFDKNQYYRVLKNARLKAKDYEESLKKQILLDKLTAIINIKPTNIERELFASAMFMKDRLAISTVSIEPSTVIVNDEELQKFWEPQKSNFLTKKSYTLETIFVPSSNEEVSEDETKSFYDESKYNYKDSEGKVKAYEDAKEDVIADLKLKKAKKIALETYLLLKKSQTEPKETKVVFEGDPSIPADKLQNVSTNQVLKPIPQKNGYLVARVKSIATPKPMSFEQAKPLIRDTFKQQQLTAKLSEKAEAQLEVFKGTDIGFVSRDDVKSIAGLTEEETAIFLSKVFDNNKQKRGFVVMGSRAVLYDILEQKLLDNEKITQYKAMLDENIAQIKSNEIRQNLISALSKRYSIEEYYKGK